MREDRLRRQMQEALDNALSSDEADALMAKLLDDDHAAREFNQLQALDDLLGRAPFERAPSHLAATIMARLAEQVEQELETVALPEELHEALLLSMSVVVVALTPTMVAAAWLVMSGLRKPELIGRVAFQAVALMRIMVDALDVLLDEVEAFVREHPEMAPVAMSLIPLTVLGLLEYLQGEADEAADET
jgi:hypothetical protein